VLAGETAARLVRVHDARRGGRRIAGQVMVGHQHAHAQPVGLRDAVDRRDAVVHGDEQARGALRRLARDLGRQAIAVLEAVGDEVLDVRAEAAQGAHAERAGRGAVGVVVGDDQHPFAACDRIGEHARGLVDVRQDGRGDEGLERGRELVDARHSAGSVQASEARVASAREEAREGDVVHGAIDDLRHGRRAACAAGTSASARKA
jgi:hypothetical protein